MLPDEILSMIFFEYGARVEAWPLGQWRRLMLVCRRWREVGLAHATLWSFVTSDSYFLRRTSLSLEQRLQRSAGTTLTCKFDLLGRSHYRAADLDVVLNGHGHRIGSLDLSGDPDDLQAALEETGDLPMLVELKIRCFLDNLEPQWTAPAQFMQLNLTHIQRLHLRGLEFSCYHVLSNLTQLHLQNDKGQDATTLPSFQDIIGIVARSPHLVKLELQSYWRENEEASNSLMVGNTITLPYLERIDVHGGRLYLTALLKTLHFPTTTIMSLNVSDAYNGLWIRDLLVPLRLILHRRGVSTLRSLAIHGAAPGYLHIFAHTDQYCEGSFARDLFGDHAFFTLVARPVNARAVRSIITKVFNMLPIQPSTNLTLGARWMILDTNYSMKTWVTICQLLQRLKAVVGNVRANVAVIVQGITKAMERGTKGVPGRRRRRLIREAPLNPSTLRLHCQSRWKSDPGASPETYQQYDGLIAALQEYRDAELPGKPAGVMWDRLEFGHSEDKEKFPDLYDNWERLKEVTRGIEAGDDGSGPVRMK